MRSLSAGFCQILFVVFVIVGGLLFLNTDYHKEPVATFSGLGLVLFAAVGWLLLALFGPED